MPATDDNPLFGLSNTDGTRYVNPFYGVAHKFLPQTWDHMCWWSNVFLLRFGFYRSALQRIANYHITALKIECDSENTKEQYKKIFDKVLWKQELGKAGLNLLGYGNLFASFNQGFSRMLICPECEKVYNLRKIHDYGFDPKGQYTYKCQACEFNGQFEVVDKPSKDTAKLNVTFWNPREIMMRYDKTTGESEYYWNIPATYRARVLKDNNKFYSKYTPKIIFDALLMDKMLEFNPSNFIHLRVPSPAGIESDGRSVPFCIYMFDDFFALKMLQRYNEAICMEDIVPFRVISMAESTNMNPMMNPLLMQNSGDWRANVDKMIKDHRKDPASYHVFPFPINYQQLSAQGKALAPFEMMQQSVSNILNALQIPNELLTMSLQTQAVGPALRLFENSWRFLVDSYNTFLQKWADVISAVTGLPEVKVGLVPITLADDMERKSVISQLVSANAIAKSEMLNLYGFGYEDQIRKKMEEGQQEQDIQKEEQMKQQLRQMSEAPGQGMDGGQQPNSTPQDIVSQAEQIAQELFPLDGAQRRQRLQEIKMTDEQLYGIVKAKLQELTSGAASQGVAQAKQQQQPQ